MCKICRCYNFLTPSYKFTSNWGEAWNKKTISWALLNTSYCIIFASVCVSFEPFLSLSHLKWDYMNIRSFLTVNYNSHKKENCFIVNYILGWLTLQNIFFFNFSHYFSYMFMSYLERMFWEWVGNHVKAFGGRVLTILSANAGNNEQLGLAAKVKTHSSSAASRKYNPLWSRQNFP